MADYSLIEGALQRGYSMDEIADKLAQAEGFDPSVIRSRGYGSEEIIGRLGYAKPEAPKPTRNAFAYANDTAIDVANSATGLLKAGVDLVAPDSSVSESMSGFIKRGEESQSDWKKQSRADLQQKLSEANGEFDKAGIYAKHAVVNDPLGTAAQIAGNAAPFAIAGRAMQGLQAASKVIASVGLSSGLTAGEVRGNIYEKIKNTPDSVLSESSQEYMELRKRMSEDEAKSVVGSSIINNIPELAAAAIVGGLGGKYGFEGMMTGVAPKFGGRIVNGLVGVADEATQGAVEQLASNVGVRRVLPSQSLTEDVGLNAAAEGIMGVGAVAAPPANVTPSPSITSASTTDDAIKAFQDEVASVTQRGSFGGMDELAGLIESERSDLGNRRGLLAQQQQDARDMVAEFSGLVKDEQIDQSYRLNDAQNQREADRLREGDFSLAEQQREEQQGRTVEQQVAASEAQGFGEQEPTAMQLAMQLAKQKALDSEFDGLLKQERTSINELRANVKKVAGVPVESISTPQLEEIAQSEAHPNTKMAAVAALNDRHDAIQQERERLMQLRETRLERQSNQPEQGAQHGAESHGTDGQVATPSVAGGGANVSGGGFDAAMVAADRGMRETVGAGAAVSSGGQTGAVPVADQPANVRALTDGRKATFTKHGDFWNISGEIARDVAKALDTTLLKGRDGLPMVGIPDHAVEQSRNSLRDVGIAAEFEPPAVEVRAPVQRKLPASNNIAQAIINLGGISTSLKTDILGDASIKTRPGLFTTNGTGDLGEIAAMLSSGFGFSQIDLNDPTDNSGAKQLADLIARSVNGETIHNEEAMIRAQEQEQYEQARAEINQQAADLNIKPIRGKRTLEIVQAEINAILAEREEMTRQKQEAQRLLDEVAEQELIDAFNLQMQEYHDENAITRDDRRAESARLSAEESAQGDGDPVDQAAPSESRAGAIEGGRGEAEVTPEFGLVGQTEEEAIAAEQTRRDEEAKRQREEQDAENKRQADAERDSFNLSGSPLPADELAARGQEGLFEQKADPIAAVKATLDAAGVTGTDRTATIAAVRRGDLTPVDVAESHPVATREFIKAPDGSTDFGEITQEQASAMRRQAGKIRLERGDASYGLQHIEERHGAQIRSIGFNSVEEFVADAVKHIDAIWKPAKTSQLVMLQSSERGKAVFIELKPAESGDFYTVNTAFPVGDGYADKKEGWRLLWGGASVPTVSSGDNPLAGTSPSAGATPAMTPGQSSDATIADQQAEGKIEDFGAKIGGAKKDRAAALRDAVTRELSDDEIASQPLSKIWPKESIDQIEDSFIAAVAHTARAEVPVKPRVGYKVGRWVTVVKTMRELTGYLLNGSVSKEQFSVKLKEGSRLLEHFGAKVALLEAIDRQNWDRIGKVSEHPNAYAYDADGKRIPTPMVLVEIDGKSQKYKVASVADVLDKVRDALGEAPQDKKIEFEVRGQPGRYAINKKGDKIYRKLKTFETTKEAFEFRDKHYAELVAAWEAVKDSDNVKETDVRRAENRPRTAHDWRNGKDVTPEEFQDAFSFRGIEFGNWVAQGKGGKERQGMLNQAYDALMDLASIIGVPPKAMSLNGTLGLGFGSRGSGKFAAHFEPNMLVINLTKTRGAGSLAHEWFHALDNYFQSQRGKGVDFITNNPENYYVHKQSGTKLPARAFGKMIEGEIDATYGSISQRYRDRSQWELKEGVRTEVAEAFADLVKALNESPMAKRASLIDKGRSGGYWSRIIERGARSFENYVIHKMMLNGYHNDYLANVTSIEEFSRDPGRYPYLLEGEIQPVAEAFDNLFATIQTKETGSGVAMFSRGRGKLRSRPRGEITHETQRLEKEINRDLARQGQATIGAAGFITRSAVPDNAHRLVKAVEKLFGVRVEFVQVEDERANIFNGVFLGGNTLFVNVDSSRPISTVIGHEFLHFLKESNHDIYAKVEKDLLALANARKFAAAAIKHQPAMNAGEEVIADTFGDQFSNPEFWEELANRLAPSLFMRVRAAFTRFLGKLLGEIKATGTTHKTDALYSDLSAVRDAVLSATVEAANGRKLATPEWRSLHARFMTAWHGSPHDHDGFSMAHIGTGEGAQAYGYGLYFAGAREVAEGYRVALTSSAAKKQFDVAAALAAAKWFKSGMVVNGTTYYSRMDLQDDIAKQNLSSMHMPDEVRQVFADKLSERNGRLYQVELAPTEDEYLDYDRPLSDLTGSSKAAIFQGSPDGISRNAESLGDLIKRESFRSQGFSGLDAPTQSFVFEQVSRAVKDNEVLNSVVRLIPVDVMNILFEGNELSAKKILHNSDMLKDLLSSSTDKPVSSGVNGAVSSLVRIVADHIAKRPVGVFGREGSDNFASAMGAGVGESLHKRIIQEIGISATGGDFYKAISRKLGSDKAASKYLHSLGIRGIRYLDGSSRSAGEGNHNFVIFDDKDVKITAKESRSALSREAFAHNALQELATEDALFRYPVSKSASVDGVMREVFPGVEYYGEHTLPDERGETGADHRYVFRTPDTPAKDGRPEQKGKQFEVFTTDAGRVWVDVYRLQPGDQGSRVYAAVANYAHNARKVFGGDPVGVSPAAIIARTKMMLASALRFGTTRHLNAAREQEKGMPDDGIPPLEWRGNDIDKTRALIQNYLATVHSKAPAIRNYSYDFDTKRFVNNATGLEFHPSGPAFDAALGEDQRRAAGVGADSGRAAILIQSLVSKESGGIGDGGILQAILDDSRSLIEDGGLKGLFSMTTPANAGVSVSAPSESVRRIQAVVERFKQLFKGTSALDIRVVSTTFDIPARFRPSPFAEGVFHDDAGLVYLVTMNLRNQRGDVNEGRAWQVLLHEAVGHYGLSQMMGEKFAGILKAVKQATSTKGRVTDETRDTFQPGDKDYATWDAVKLRYPDVSDSELAQEVLARMSETDPGSSVLGYAVATVRQWVRDVARAMGVNVMVSTSELRDLVAKASGYMRRGDNLADERASSGLVAASKLYSMSTGLESRAATVQPQGPIWAAPEMSRTDNIIYTMQDKNIDLKRVQQAIKETVGEIRDDIDAYLQEELFHGRAAKITEEFLDKEVNPLISLMRASNVSMEEMETFLWARHAKERNAQIAKINDEMPDGGSGLTNKQADDLMGGKDVTIGDKTIAGVKPARKKLLSDLAGRVDAITNGNRALRERYGLESAETLNAWDGAYQHYVPLHREDTDSHLAGIGTGQGYSVKGSSSKRATGSFRPVENILANLALQRERIITRGEKNRVAQALHGLAKEMPNADLWEVDVKPTMRTTAMIGGREQVVDAVDPNFRNKPNVVFARFNGEDRFVVFNEHNERAVRMAEALKNLDADDISHLLGEVSRWTRYFASINTQYNPIFGVTNLVRDVQTGLLNLKSTPLDGKQMEMAGGLVHALPAVFKALRADRKGQSATGTWAQLWEEFQEVGGQTGYRDMFRNSHERAEALQNALDPAWWQKTWWGKAATVGGILAAPEQVFVEKVGKPLMELLSDYNTMMENGIRLSAYKLALDSGMTKERAASLAKNLTVNFNRKGQAGRQVGAMYAFFNASIQGTARMAETLNHGAKPGELLGKAGKQIVYGGLLLGVVQAMLLMAAGFDDEEPPEHVRDRNIIIPTGNGKYISIPMPLGFHVLPAISRISIEFTAGGFKKPGEHLVHIMDVLLDSFNPIGNAGLSMQTLAPTVLDPVAALTENKDWSGRQIARQDFSKLNPTPGYTRAKDTASSVSRGLAYALNYLSGGGEYGIGIVSPTPDQIEYLIGQVTGGVGRELGKVATTGEAIGTGEDLPPHKIPLVGRFYGDTMGQSSEASKFYGTLEKLAEHKGALDRMKDAHASEAYQDYLRKHPESRLYGRAASVQREVANLRKLKRQLLDRGADRAKIRQVEDRMKAVMARFNQSASEHIRNQQ